MAPVLPTESSLNRNAWPIEGAGDTEGLLPVSSSNVTSRIAAASGSNGSSTSPLQTFIEPPKGFLSQHASTASGSIGSDLSRHGRGFSPTAGGHGLHGGEKCGVGKTLGNIFISFVGAGVLGLPYAFAKSGVVLGVVVMVIVSFLAYVCIMLLVDCKHTLETKGVNTYSEVAAVALGPTGKVVVESLLVLSQTGFCVAYLLFISDNLSQLTPMNKFAVVALILPLQVALAMLQNLSALAPFTLVADAAIVIGMLVVLKDDIGNFSVHEKVVVSKGISAVPFLFGVVIYCYEGIGMILPVQDSMKDKSKFRSTMTIGFFLITFVFVAFGVIGYAAFGETTKDIITDNLPDDWTTSAVKLFLCVGLFFTFPVMMVPVYEISERALDASAWFQMNITPSQRLPVQRLGRFLIVLLVGVLAVSVPGFGMFISLIGSLCCASLAFIIPALCHIMLNHSTLSLPALALDYFLVLFGIVGMVIGVTDSIRSMFEEYGVLEGMPV